MFENEIDGLARTIIQEDDGDELMMSTICYFIMKAGFSSPEQIRLVGVALSSFLIGQGRLEPGAIVRDDSAERGIEWQAAPGGVDEWAAMSAAAWLTWDDLPNLGGPVTYHVIEADA